MPYAMLASDQSLFAVWGRPEIADVIALKNEVVRIAARSGHPITFVTRVPAEAEAPSGAVQKAVNDSLNTIINDIATYHVVLEGRGFVAAAKRSVLALIFLAARRRGMFFVHSRADEVVAHVKPEARRQVADLLRAASARGLLDCPPPTTSPVSPTAGTA